MAKLNVLNAPTLDELKLHNQIEYDRPWYEDAAEIGRQGLAGVADAARMGGQALRYVSEDTSGGEQLGRAIARKAESWQQQLAPNTFGEGAISGTLAKGLRGTVAAIPSIGASILATPLAGSSVAAAQYGLSSAQDTEDKLISQGIDPAEARKAGIGTGVIQGLGEGIATYATGGLYRAAKPAAGAAMEAVAKGVLDTRAFVPYAKQVLKNLIIQPTTEVLQDTASSKVEEAYGAKPEDLIAQAKESAQGAVGMTIWTSLLGIPGAAGRANAAKVYNYALTDPTAPPELKQQAIDAITSLAKDAKVNPEAIAQWITAQNAGAQGEQNEVDLTAPAPAAPVEGLRRPAALPDSMFTQPSAQRDLFDQVGGPAPVAGEQLDLFGGGGQMQVSEVDPRQGDLFAPQEATFGTQLTASMLDSVGLPRQSPFYRQLLGKDMADPAVQPLVADIMARVRADSSISERTKTGVEGLAMQAFGSLAKQQEMFGPRGGAYPQGKPSTQQNAPGPIENLLPTAPLGPVATEPQAPAAPAAPVEAAPAVAQPTAMPTVPAGVTLTADENRLLKQASAVYGIAETDAERASIGAMMQRTIDRAVQRNPAAVQVSPPGAASAVSPAAPVVAGVSSEGTPSGTEAPQTVKTETQRPATAAVRVADRQTAEQQAQDEIGLMQALQAANRTSTGSNPLQASVEGAGKVSVPGKASLGVNSLRNIRDALLNPSATVDGISQKEQRVADAVRAFAKAYYKLSNKGGNMLRGIPSERGTRAENGEMVYKATKFAGQTPAQQLGQIKAKTGARVSALLDDLNTTRAALSELGAAVNGNAKDVEAIVRMVKDMVQQKLHTEVADDGMNEDFGQEGEDATAAAFGKLDTMLSQGWNAAKANMFQGNSDAMFVRQTAIRNSTEATAAGEKATPLEKAATGYAVFGKGEASEGLLGVMNYIQTHGTPFERTIAKAVFESMAYQNPPKLVFITEGKPRFDPKKNTVYIQRDASAAVTLHEALHAALQWYVYKNPDAPEVRALKASLKQVVAYKGALGADAKRVQDLLKALVKDKKELDAVLELVSYGNTLNDFRRALEGMDSTEAPKSFFNAATNVWQSILTAVQKLLGVKPSVASDVIGNTFKLLEAAGQKSLKKDKATGNVLEAAIEATIPQPSQQSDAVNLQKYKDTPGWSINITRSFLEQVGFGEGGRAEKAARGMMDKAAQTLVREFPGLAGNLRNISSKFGLNTEYKQAAAVSKQDKQAGLVEAEALMQRLYRSPADAVRVFSYLNGDNKALSDEGRDVALRDTADAISELLDTYIQSLPAADRRMFEGLKFTDKLLKPEGLADLAKKSFGMHSVRAIFRPEDRVETNIEDFKKLLPMQNDVVDSTKPLFQTFETLGGVRVPNGFVGEAQANDHPELDIDRSRVWYFEGKQNGPEKGFKFRTRNISGANLMDVAKRMGDPKLSAQEKEAAAQQISSALLTTMAALSHNAATKNFFASLAPMGRNEDGSATETTAVFNDVDEINSVFKGRTLTDANVLDAADDEAKIKYIRSVAQRGDVWVRLPDTDHYGPLRGKIISGGMWSDMLDMHDRSPLINNETLNNLMSAFKKSKTVFSPATHANNILTNYAMMLLHGISHKAVGDAAAMIAKYELSPGSLTKEQREIMKAFYKSGAVLGQFTNAETKSFLAQKLAQNITQQNERSLLTKLAGWAGYEQEFSKYATKLARGGKLAENAMSEVYAAGDNVFRLAAFMNVAGTLQAKNNGVLGEEQLKQAGLAARQMFLDYDIDSRWVRAARQSAFPFISWSYAIMPVLGRLAITKPWTMINMMAALYAMGMMGDDDEWRKKGPDAVRERSLWGMGPYNMVRIPFVGTDKNPMYYNIGKSIPMMSVFEPAQGKTKLFGSEYIPGVLQPSGPYVTLLANTLFNLDPFTGKPLHGATDDQFDKIMKTSGAVWDTFAPSPLTTRTYGQVKDWWDEKKGPTGKPNDGLAFARLFGMGVYQYDKAETEFYQSKKADALRTEFKKVMNKARRDEMAKGHPDYAALDKELAELRVKMDKQIAEAKGEE